MIGLFWNCRGAGKKGMKTSLSHIISGHSLDFLCLQETFKKNFLESYFRKLEPHKLLEWEWIPSIGKVGGILCGVKKDKFEVIAWRKGRFILQVSLYDISMKKV